VNPNLIHQLSLNEFIISLTKIYCIGSYRRSSSLWYTHPLAYACIYNISSSSYTAPTPPPFLSKKDIFLLHTKDTSLLRILFLFCKLGIKVISFSPPSSNPKKVRVWVRVSACLKTRERERTSRREVWVEGCHLLQLQSYEEKIKLYLSFIQSPSHSITYTYTHTHSLFHTHTHAHEDISLLYFRLL